MAGFTNRKMKLQDKFLSIMKEQKIEGRFFFRSGFQAMGYIKTFDPYTIVIEKNHESQIIYKSSLNKIEPVKYVRLMPPKEQKD